ncbi:MAG: hypothetical protein NDJ24_04455 [Alphaproteobacteria bacterium]|nr:hypothetical protein [Alphaproteobacteria bacterium]
MTTATPENTTLRALFNARAMLKKVGRDVAICGTLYATPLAMRIYENPEMYTLESIPAIAGILAALTGITALSMSMGRYAGGAVGLGIDALSNKIAHKPALSCMETRKSLAAIGGFIGVSACYIPYLVMTAIMTNATENTEPPTPQKPELIFVSHQPEPLKKLHL